MRKPEQTGNKKSTMIIAVIMRSLIVVSLAVLLFLPLPSGCTYQFRPGINETQDNLVVDGMITDQFRVNSVRLTRSSPIGVPFVRTPVTGAIVTITDQDGMITTLTENQPGIYCTDSLKFRGCPGGSYALDIGIGNSHYETDFIKMKPVPPIDSLYWEKVTVTDAKDYEDIEEGCRIYVNSFDPSGNCLFFRWDYEETWEYRIPYSVTNKQCWITHRSDGVIIRNTTAYNQARISKFPILLIGASTGKLKVKYSMLLNEYSLNAEEYDFWERVYSISQNVGNLYDQTPATISGNIRCTTNPGEVVLGYFSVSAVSQNRIFVEGEFLGQPSFYSYCATDTIFDSLPVAGRDSTYWVIEDNQNEIPPWWVITEYRECADCRTEGTSIKPSWWIDAVEIEP